MLPGNFFNKCAEAGMESLKLNMLMQAINHLRKNTQDVLNNHQLTVSFSSRVMSACSLQIAPLVPLMEPATCRALRGGLCAGGSVSLLPLNPGGGGEGWNVTGLQVT